MWKLQNTQKIKRPSFPPPPQPKPVLGHFLQADVCIEVIGSKATFEQVTGSLGVKSGA